MPRLIPLVLALSIALALSSGAYLILNRPTTIRVAVGPPKSQLVNYVRAIAQALDESREGFRVRIVESEGSVHSSKLLDEGKVDLAIVRSDDGTSQAARAVVVIHRKVLLFVTPSSRKEELLRVVQDGSGGMLRTVDATFLRVIHELYEHYGLTSSIPLVEIISEEDAIKGLKEKTIDYLAALVHPSDRDFHRLLLSLNVDGAHQFEVAAPPAAPGAAAQLRGLESAELIEGLLGGTPPLPRQPLTTVSVTYELVASSDYNERRVALLTKTLLDLRATLRGVHDGGLRIEAPALDQARRFLPHTGTAKQLEGELESFLEANSDVIWMAIFGVGFLGSALSATFTVLRSRGRRRRGEVKTQA